MVDISVKNNSKKIENIYENHAITDCLAARIKSIDSFGLMIIEFN